VWVDAHGLCRHRLVQQGQRSRHRHEHTGRREAGENDAEAPLLEAAGVGPELIRIEFVDRFGLHLRHQAISGPHAPVLQPGCGLIVGGNRAVWAMEKALIEKRFTATHSQTFLLMK